MYLKVEIEKEINEFYALCKKHRVKFMYAFGSSVTEKFDDNHSDVDLLVEIDETEPLERGEKLISLWDNLEVFFHKSVDLITDSSINNPYLRKSIDDSKILIYDGQRQKVLV